MDKIIRIGTRESQLAVWQATLVQQQLSQHGFASELVYIKSDGDIDLVTPLYEIGVQGVFTKTLDAALLSNRIDIAVHSMKDVPTQLAKGIVQAAVLPRASYKDILVYKGELSAINDQLSASNDHPPLGDRSFTIATSSIRRRAQWLHRYPHHHIDNLRGNVNTRLRKVEESNWNGAIFAAAGLERIGLRPANAIELDWMLPAPAQGAIMIVCNESDVFAKEACALLNDATTALCAKMERDFLRTLLGGCSTPISALAEVKDNIVYFKGNIYSIDGREKAETEKQTHTADIDAGTHAALEVLENGGRSIVETIRNAK
ncbi:hydroxymethylbilane synthase [Russula earlei]|uniref:Hydroxymethylbilane synthase n=1 Tax=Russula earlei TaxID=71964 RepID=A0ACC0TRV0_9AGAM|nr:hydroxymethylbilane synthase [Russula earlei]